MEFIHRFISFLLLFAIVPLHIFIALLKIPVNFLCWLHWQNFWKYDLEQPNPLPETGQVLFEKLRYPLWQEILIRIYSAVWYSIVLFLQDMLHLNTIKI